MDAMTAQTLIRFGLGRRPSEAVPADLHGWLAHQLEGPEPANFVGLSTTADALIALQQDRAERRANPAVRPQRTRQLFQADASKQLANAIETSVPFRERLVWFWANHFTVSRRRHAVTAIIGPFIREAIRPHITGRFADLLLAVMRHPAMLMYLDNGRSVGPNSPIGQRLERGINENLARECLELHTLSAASGYTQADVTEFAKILTGWSVDREAYPPGFLFRPDAHESGAKHLMGREFPPGEEGGVQALAFLARHPATSRHLATKLVSHFVADDPPTDAVRQIEGVLRDSDGDIGAAALAVTRIRAAWHPLAKVRTSQDYAIACLRAVELPPASRPDLLDVLEGLGQPVWAPPLPDWAAPDGLVRRIDWVYELAGGVDADAVTVGEATLGPWLPPATIKAVHHAGSRREAFTLLLASPEFMRR
jgi:uncharacterized protein (DUF1800 family)